jgi:hypothetical protein
MAGHQAMGRAATMACFIGALVAMIGCGNLLGFQDTVYVSCYLNSQCPDPFVCTDGRCSPQCYADRDCQLDSRYLHGSVCSDGVCALPEAAAASSADGSTDSSADAIQVPATDVSHVDAETEAAQSGECIPACKEFSACQAGACLSVINVGIDSPTGDVQLAENGFLQAMQAYVDVCGLATGIGFELAVADQETYRFGLYTDSGGNPDRLVAQTESHTVQIGTNKASLTPVATVGCGQGGAYYWIVGTWNQNAVAFVAETTPAPKWIRVFVPNDSQDLLMNGLPEFFPGGGTVIMSKQLHVFITVAHP